MDDLLPQRVAFHETNTLACSLGDHVVWGFVPERLCYSISVVDMSENENYRRSVSHFLDYGSMHHAKKIVKKRQKERRIVTGKRLRKNLHAA